MTDSDIGVSMIPLLLAILKAVLKTQREVFELVLAGSSTARSSRVGRPYDSSTGPVADATLATSRLADGGSGLGGDRGHRSDNLIMLRILGLMSG